MKFITDYIAGLGFYGCFVQLVGFAATLLEILAFQQKTRKRIMICQSISSFLWITHMFLLGAPSGALQNIVKLIMSTVFFFRTTHKWAGKWWWYPIFMSASAAGAACSWILGEGWLAIFPFVSMVLTIIAFSMSNPFRIRLISLTVSPFWLTYDVFSGSIAGVVADTLNLISIIIGIIRIDIAEIRKRKKAEKLKENT